MAMRSYCLMGAGSQSGKMKEFWRQTVVMIVQNVIVLDATEPYT